jgi:hypothetical protein
MSRCVRSGGAALALLLLFLATAPTAGAEDGNSLPPSVKLTPGGRNNEGVVGPKQAILATFETEEPDPSWAYRTGSKVSFTCLLDGGPVDCPVSFEGCCRMSAPAASHQSAAESTPALPPYGYGRFAGTVPVPPGLASGSHTITVSAADEDGTSPTPATIAVIYDDDPPEAPQLTQAPPRRSHIRKPIFRFTATDAERLVGSRDREFAAVLRRLDPPGVAYRENDSESFMDVWGARCPTLLTCSTRAQAAYMASEQWYSYGEPERLTAGLYEFRVRALDAVGNKSPLKTYRFRILPGKAPSGPRH